MVIGCMRGDERFGGGGWERREERRVKVKRKRSREEKVCNMGRGDSVVQR